MILHIFRKRAANSELTRVQLQLAELENMKTQLSPRIEAKNKEALAHVHHVLSDRQLLERDVVVGSYKQTMR